MYWDMKCSELIVPENIMEEEDVARIIFSPSMIMNGNVSPSAFFMDELPRGPERYVSVWRAFYRTPTMENVTFGARKGGDSLAGYAIIGVWVCHSTCYEDYKTQIKPHPSKSNPAHAGIHVTKGAETIKGQCYDPGYLMLATMLAGKCTLVTF